MNHLNFDYLVFLLYYVVNGLFNEKEYDLYIGYVLTFLILISINIYEYAFHYRNQEYNLVKLVSLFVIETVMMIWCLN